MPMIAMTDARTNPFGKVSARIDITLHMTTGGTVNARLQKTKKNTRRGSNTFYWHDMIRTKGPALAIPRAEKLS